MALKRHPKNKLTIAKEEWEAAEKHFSDVQGTESEDMKLRRADSKLKHSFIKIENTIYAMNEEGEYLGEGAFGKVKLIQRKDGLNYTVKIEGREKRPESDNELQIMKATDFFISQASRKLTKDAPFLKNDKAALTKIKLYTVTPLKPGYTLFDLIYSDVFATFRRDDLTQTQSILIAIKLCLAVRELHQSGVIHGDIKPENIIVDLSELNIDIGLIDFGHAGKITLEKNYFESSKKSSPNYMAPEIEKPDLGIYSEASDIYAIAVILQNDLQIEGIEGKMSQMLEKDPMHRTSMSELLLILLGKLQNQPEISTIQENDEDIAELIQKHRSPPKKKHKRE